MNKSNFAVFIFGLAVGSAAAWLCLKRRYEQIAQEEIDSVKTAFAERKNQFDECDTADGSAGENEKTSQVKFENIVSNYAEINDKKEKNDMPAKPYIISPEQFGDIDDYDQISLTYYADDVLVDDEDEVINNTDEIVGADFADHFGEYEDDSVFVRNDRLKCDYEILRDNRSWGDAR